MYGCAVELYTTAQKQSESIDDCYMIFIVQKYTVNAHSGQVGRHERLCAESWTQIMGERGVNKNRMNTDADIKIEIEEAASTSSSNAFLAYLFILMADNTLFKPLKVQ